MSEIKNNKIWFAQLLRGVAALLVVYSHLCIGFWAQPETSASIAHTLPINQEFNLFTFKINTLLSYFNISLSQLGVAIFFLISGFVIPISLEKLKVRDFLIARFFRIYPVVFVSLLITLFSVFIYGQFHNIDFPYSLSYFLKNVSLLREWYWIIPIEYAIWTLEVEMKFYIVCACIKWLSNIRSAKPILVLSVIFSLFNYLTHGLSDFLMNNNLLYLYKFFYVLSANNAYLTYMFIGICFYCLYQKYWKKEKFIVVVTTLYTLFYISAKYNLNPSLIGKSLAPTHFVALIVFVIFYIAKEKIPYSKILDYIANISYPLYIVHGTMGFILLTTFYSLTSKVYISIIITLIIVLLVAYILHKLIELPSAKLGKIIPKLINKWI